MISVNVKKLTDSAKIPTYAHIGDAGADLYASEDCIVYSNNQPCIVPTGIAIEIPPGYVGLIYPRSGLAANHRITVLNSPGTIDSGYRGELKVILFNHSGGYPYHIKAGDKIAQMVFHKYSEVFFEPVDELNDTQRGIGGFGSSGK
jgi:dUTP pyrophosphatase